MSQNVKMTERKCKVFKSDGFALYCYYLKVMDAGAEIQFFFLQPRHAS